ncbi:hypothetical protein PENCOP_c004G01052 [Penicillium coprophilum]|uniref:Uncharacterized protein n=1 Tax=Penicillium coprophilum TaxID=36646 RepID=A0A1V6UTS2_9EURO|nr:hypothetical protein PENCOP_c004G01052 [Penicillium coprophilum]
MARGVIRSFDISTNLIKSTYLQTNIRGTGGPDLTAIDRLKIVHIQAINEGETYLAFGPLLDKVEHPALSSAIVHRK